MISSAELRNLFWNGSVNLSSSSTITAFSGTLVKTINEQSIYSLSLGLLFMRHMV
jgi:hypothetical protein